MLDSIKKMLQQLMGSSSEDSNQATDITFYTLGKFNLGVGKIGPDNRTDIDQNVLKEMYRRVAAGEFNIPVSGTLPEICVDGRTNRQGSRINAPSAAGGSLTMVYGRDLGDSGALNDKTEMQLTIETMDALKAKGYATAVHGDDHSNCGCGACAHAQKVYQHITDKIDPIAGLTGNYGIIISDTEKASIVGRAKNRLDHPSFFNEDRSAILQACQDHGANYEELVDAHNELGIAINMRQGTTIDRKAIRTTFGPQYDLFVVDAWTFATAAQELALESNKQDADRIAKAITIQNVATASVLGHSSLPIIPIG